MDIDFISFLKKYPREILNLIISKNIISKAEALHFKAVFEKFSPKTIIVNREIFEKGFMKKEKYDFYGMDNYFMVNLYKKNDQDFLNLKEDIVRNFDVYNIRMGTGFHIHKSQFEDFIERYKNRSEIGWGDICLNKCLNFSHDIISKYDHLLCWEVLQYSGNLHWTFDLIDAKKEILNWSVVSSYDFLKWDIDTIEKYKEYLIFSLGEGWRKSVIFGKRGSNKKGQHFEIGQRGLQKNLFNFELKGSISLCETINWSIDILDKFYDYWDWEELCLNKGIKWDDDLIEKYFERVNFKAISSNTSTKWSIELIEKHIEKWDWAELSNNIGINFSFEILSRFEEYWHWVPKINNWYFDEYEKEKVKKSLCSNKNINWSIEIVDKFYEKIDFWRISLNGIICNEVLIKYSHEFDRIEKCGFEYHKWSDFRADENIYKNGWENLKNNPQIKFSVNIIEFFKNYKTTITYSFGNLAYDGEIIKKTISLLELFKGKDFKGLTFESIALNNHNWGEVFFNNEFVNRYLFEKAIIPKLSNDIAIKFLEELKM